MLAGLTYRARTPRSWPCPFSHPRRTPRNPIPHSSAAPNPGTTPRDLRAGAEPRAAVVSLLCRTAASLKSRRSSAVPPGSFPSRPGPSYACVAPEFHPAAAAGKCSAREIPRRRRDSDLPDPSTGFAARPRSFPWSPESRRTPASTRPRAPHRPHRSPSTPPPLHGRLARFRASVSPPSPRHPFALDTFACGAP